MSTKAQAIDPRLIVAVRSVAKQYRSKGVAVGTAYAKVVSDVMMVAMDALDKNTIEAFQQEMDAQSQRFVEKTIERGFEGL